MAKNESEGILSELFELALLTPDYDDANRHEHHSRVRDFMLDVKDLALRIAKEKDEWRKAKQERLAAWRGTQNN